jgi:hypothetical protein
MTLKEKINSLVWTSVVFNFQKSFWNCVSNHAEGFGRNTTEYPITMTGNHSLKTAISMKLMSYNFKNKD